MDITLEFKNTNIETNKMFGGGGEIKFQRNRKMKKTTNTMQGQGVCLVLKKQESTNKITIKQDDEKDDNCMHNILENVQLKLCSIEHEEKNET